MPKQIKKKSRRQFRKEAIARRYKKNRKELLREIKELNPNSKIT